MMVAEKLESAMEARAWQNMATTKINVVGLSCWKGLESLEIPYLISIEASSNAIRTA